MSHLNRRNAIATAAALPVMAAMPTAAAVAVNGDDPIHAAVAAHREAAAQVRTMAASWDEMCFRFAEARDEQGRAAVDAELDRKQKDAHNVAWALVDNPPTTVDGVAALLAYVAEVADADGACLPGGCWDAALHQRLAHVLRGIAA